MNKDNILMKILSKLDGLLHISKKHYKISKEHKEISSQHLKKSMSKREQRAWQVIVILVMVIMVIIGGGIYIKLGPFGNDEIPDYDIKVGVFPDKIMENYDDKIEFKINFTNTGKKDIKDFEILGAELYRIEDGKPIAKHTLIYPFDNEEREIDCTDSYISNLRERKEFKVGDTCIATTREFSCPTCFDDKDKIVQIFVYFKSVPPLDNKVINLTIY